MSIVEFGVVWTVRIVLFGRVKFCRNQHFRSGHRFPVCRRRRFGSAGWSRFGRFRPDPEHCPETAKQFRVSVFLFRRSVSFALAPPHDDNFRFLLRISGNRFAEAVVVLRVKILDRVIMIRFRKVFLVTPIHCSPETFVAAPIPRHPDRVCADVRVPDGFPLLRTHP